MFLCSHLKTIEKCWGLVGGEDGKIDANGKYFNVSVIHEIEVEFI